MNWFEKSELVLKKQTSLKKINWFEKFKPKIKLNHNMLSICKWDMHLCCKLD